MDNIISEIIKTEQQAKQITKDAMLMKKNLNEDIIKEIALLKEKSLADAKALTERAIVEKQKSIEDEIKKSRQIYNQKIKEIDAKYNENREQWVEIIYNKMIGA